MGMQIWASASQRRYNKRIVALQDISKPLCAANSPELFVCEFLPPTGFETGPIARRI